VNTRAFCRTCLGLALAFSCRQPAVDRTAPPATKTASSARVATQPVAASPPSSGSSARKGESAATPPKAAAPVSESVKAEDDLQSEEREANPLSETVTLTLSISPPVKASVMWGSKQLARIAPDNPTVELQRPRNTGPLDLEIRAEGFLPHHTRLYSDRNDKVSVRLVRPAEASNLLGYRSSVAAEAAKGKTK
jgi:hypothetical protein